MVNTYDETIDKLDGSYSKYKKSKGKNCELSFFQYAMLNIELRRDKKRGILS